MGYMIGVLYCYLWYSSISAGYLCLYCPILPVLLISNKLYRYLTDIIFTFWQAYPTILLQLLCKCEIQITGDSIKSNEMSILIMNHRTRTDWNFFWPALYYCTEGCSKYRYSTKFLLKDSIRHLPGPGWVMQLTSSIFIKRYWPFDRNVLGQFCHYISVLPYKCSVLVFPEGTDLTEATKKKSDKFASENHLPNYEYVLHPRTTGFCFLANKLINNKCLDAVYDVTLAYSDVIPQNEKLIFQGFFPSRVNFHIVRYPSSTLPKSEKSLKKFLENKWEEKENILKSYHTLGNFPLAENLKMGGKLELYLALVFWTILPYLTVYLLFHNTILMHICCAHTLFLVAINFITPGVQFFEIILYDLKRQFLGPKFTF